MIAKAPGAQHGFTLIELIAGIVIMAMAVAAMSGILFPQAIKSVDPVYQLRAAQLGQALINEIMAKAFDEHSDHHSAQRCGELGAGACTVAASLGPDQLPSGSNETIDQFDDVDDYHGYNQTAAQLHSGNHYNQLYRNFTFSVSVSYDDDLDGDFDSDDNKFLFKRVEVEVKTPTEQPFRFIQYKGNY